MITVKCIIHGVGSNLSSALHYMSYSAELSPRISDTEKVSKFTIARAPLTEAQIEQLIFYSREDPRIREFSSDPIRFANREGYDTFLTPDVVTYTVTDEAGNLNGFSFYLPFDLPTETEYTEEATQEMYPFSKSTKLYGQARGIGLGSQVVKFVTNDILREHPGSGIWVSINAANTPSLRSNLAVGYKQISKPDAKNHVILAYR